VPELRALQRVEQCDYKKEKCPALPGIFDDFLF
jgi:hypothetical protein